MTTEQMLMTGIGMIGTAIVSVWGSYLLLQSKKDKDIEKERDRADFIAEKALERSDFLLSEQRDRLEKTFREQLDRTERENKDLMFITISQYEKMLRVLKSQYGIDRGILVEETRKIPKNDRLSESQIEEISSDMKQILEGGQNGSN